MTRTWHAVLVGLALGLAISAILLFATKLF